jgi:uncharacterized protein
MKRSHRFTATCFGFISIIVAATCFGSAVPLRAQAVTQPGDVVISEIMNNPAAVPDAQGEWLELYNGTGTDIDLNGWQIADSATTHTISADPPLVISAGGYVVLGRELELSLNGGAPVNYTFNLFLNNDADTFTLVDDAGQEIDRVEFDVESGYPARAGASVALRNPRSDNNLGVNWLPSTAPWPGSAGDFGTPAATNGPAFNTPLTEASQAGAPDTITSPGGTVTPTAAPADNVGKQPLNVTVGDTSPLSTTLMLSSTMLSSFANVDPIVLQTSALGPDKIVAIVLVVLIDPPARGTTINGTASLASDRLTSTVRNRLSAFASDLVVLVPIIVK